MSKNNLKKIQETVKDLILFDSAWQDKKLVNSLPEKVLKRITLYKELVRNSFNSTFENIYPNTFKLVKNNWNELYTEYIKQYPPDSPLLNRVVEHLSEFLTTKKNILKKYPFISELAKFEWAEVEIYEKEDYTNNKNKQELNPIHMILRFEYPIVEILKLIEKKKAIKTIEKKQVNILLYRDPKSLKVRMFELAPGTLAYIELLKRGLNHKEATELLMEFFKVKENEQALFKQNMNNLKKELKKNKIIL